MEVLKKQTTCVGKMVSNNWRCMVSSMLLDTIFFMVLLFLVIFSSWYLFEEIVSLILRVFWLFCWIII